MQKVLVEYDFFKIADNMPQGSDFHYREYESAMEEMIRQQYPDAAVSIMKSDRCSVTVQKDRPDIARELGSLNWWDGKYLSVPQREVPPGTLVSVNYPGHVVRPGFDVDKYRAAIATAVRQHAPDADVLIAQSPNPSGDVHVESAKMSDEDRQTLVYNVCKTVNDIDSNQFRDRWQERQARFAEQEQQTRSYCQEAEWITQQIGDEGR